MTLLVSCDTAYAKLYAPAFFMSCVNAGQRLHLNIINPDDDSLAMQREMLRAAPALFESSVVEDVAHDVVAYTFSRFIVVRELLERHPERLGYYTVDVDSIVLSDLLWPLNCDVGLWLRPEENENMRVLASLCYFSVSGLPFLRRVEEHFNQLPLEWFADQIALSRAHQEMRDQFSFQDLRKLGQISWEQEDYGKAEIFQGKGPRKKRPFFLSKMEGLNNGYRERVEYRIMEAASRK